MVKKTISQQCELAMLDGMNTATEQEPRAEVEASALDALVMRIDFRPAVIDQRRVREGKMLHFEGRAGRLNEDGTVEWNDWFRTGTITNYGDVYDPKPKNWFARLFNAWRRTAKQ